MAAVVPTVNCSIGYVSASGYDGCSDCVGYVG